MKTSTMKYKYSLLALTLVLCFNLNCLTALADNGATRYQSFLSQDQAMEMTELEPTERASLLNINLNALTVTSTGSNETDSNLSDCIEQIENRQRRLIRRSFIIPLIGIPAIPTTTAVGLFAGSEVGRIITHHSLWAQVSASSIGATVGFWGSAAYFLTKEGLTLNEFYSNHKLLSLLKAIDEQDSEGLSPTLKRLKRRKAELTEEELSDAVNELIGQNKICINDKRIISYRKLLRTIAKSEDNEE